MIIGIQGTKNFDDYAVFLRGMGTALSGMDSDDKEIVIFSAGPLNINEFAMEFLNVSNWKARGIKAKLVKFPPSVVKEKMHELDHFLYFSKPKEPYTDLVEAADAKSVPVGVYRF
jgi:hypothetical protein